LQLKIKNLRNLKKGGNLSYKIEKDNFEEETENSYKNR
jgi:hypothetical protein